MASYYTYGAIPDPNDVFYSEEPSGLGSFYEPVGGGYESIPAGEESAPLSPLAPASAPASSVPPSAGPPGTYWEPKYKGGTWLKIPATAAEWDALKARIGFTPSIARPAAPAPSDAKTESIQPTGEGEALATPAGGLSGSSADNFAALSSLLSGMPSQINLGAGPTGMPITGISPSNLVFGGTGGRDLDPTRGEATLASLIEMGIDPEVAKQFSENLLGQQARGKELSAQLVEQAKAQYSPEEYARMEEAVRPLAEAQAKSRAEQEAKYQAELPDRRALSSLLKENKFDEAWQYARANNVTDLLTDPANFKDLRGPLTQSEAAAFLNATPSDLRGKDFVFDPKSGLDYATSQWQGSTGFVSPLASFSAKPDDTFKKVVNFGVDLMLAAAGIPPIPAAIAKATYTLAETGGDVQAALKAGAAAAVGAKVGQALKVPSGFDELTGVTATGPVGSAAAARAATQAATQGAASGLAGGALQEFVVQAAKAAAPGLAETVVRTVASNALSQAAAPSTAARPAEAVTSETTARTTEPSGLEEVVVTGRRAFQPSLQQALASTAASAATQDILSDRQIQEAQEADQRAQEEEAKKEEESALQTFKIETGRLPRLGVADVIPAFSQQLINSGYRPPRFAETPLDQIPEVKVTARKIEPGKLTIGDVTGALTSAALTQGFRQPNVDPLTGQVRGPSKIETELDKIQTALATGAAIPGTSSAIKDLIKKYGSLKNVLRVLGALGAAGARQPTGGGGAFGMPSLGGALPKYDLKRVALSPDIDYYTYGTRPEAKFFEYDQQLVSPEQPDLPGGRVRPEDEPVFAEGGLTGYARGGSKSARYVDGPGSGRDDKIPALLSDGEYVIDAETLALLGDGSTKEGARRMDRFRANIRKHKGRALSRGRISPNAKSPDKYMGGGLT